MPVTLRSLASQDHWRARAPGLHICEPGPAGREFPLAGATTEDLRSRLSTEGYFKARADWGVDLGLMAQTVRALSADGILPVFAFVYDEFWVPMRALAPLYRALIGDFAMMPELWVWNVDPHKGESGWRVHRDRGRASLNSDGSPKTLSTWIAVSRATPENGCMYLVPKNADPTYGTPLEHALGKLDKAAVHPDARALPAEPGDFFIWDQAILHWGGKSSPDAPESRISIAYECQRTDVAPFRAPLFSPDRRFSFESRLKLIGRQILHYKHMYALSAGDEAMARALLA